MAALIAITMTACGAELTKVERDLGKTSGDAKPSGATPVPPMTPPVPPATAPGPMVTVAPSQGPAIVMVPETKRDDDPSNGSPALEPTVDAVPPGTVAGAPESPAVLPAFREGSGVDRNLPNPQRTTVFAPATDPVEAVAPDAPLARVALPSAPAPPREIPPAAASDDCLLAPGDGENGSFTCMLGAPAVEIPASLVKDGLMKYMVDQTGGAPALGDVILVRDRVGGAYRIIRGNIAITSVTFTNAEIGLEHGTDDYVAPFDGAYQVAILRACYSDSYIIEGLDSTGSQQVVIYTDSKHLDIAFPSSGQPSVLNPGVQRKICDDASLDSLVAIWSFHDSPDVTAKGPSESSVTGFLEVEESGRGLGNFSIDLSGIKASLLMRAQH